MERKAPSEQQEVRQKKMENQQDLDKNIEEKECKIDFIGEVDVGGPGKW